MSEIVKKKPFSLLIFALILILAGGYLAYRMGCETYLKFAFENNRLWLISLHPHRIDTKGR